MELLHLLRSPRIVRDHWWRSRQCTLPCLDGCCPVDVGPACLSVVLSGASPSAVRGAPISCQGRAHQLCPERRARGIGGWQVRETLDFAARCQGAGNKPAELRQLLDLEAKAGISPNPSTDAFMKARGPRPPLRCLPSSPEQRVPLCVGELLTRAVRHRCSATAPGQGR